MSRKILYIFVKSAYTMDMDTNEWAKIVGENVLRARQTAGLTQAALGERCGLVVPALSRVEAGRSLPSLATLLRVAEGLGVEPGQLLARPTPKKSTRKTVINKRADQ